MYKLITRLKNTDDSSTGFDRDRVRRQHVLTNNKKQQGKEHVGNMLRNLFGRALHQSIATYSLGYQLT